MLCCISVVSAASDSAMDDLNANVDQGDDVSSVAIDENEDSLSVPQEETSLSKEVDDNVVSKDVTVSPKGSALSKFKNDLEENNGVVKLTDDIKISSPFIIKTKTVIDGQGHTIDAQHKTNIFVVKKDGGLTLKNVRLINGYAQKGGAIISTGGDVSIDNCKFVNNKAKEYGGALFILRAHLTVKNSLFEKNTVTSSKSAGHAGAIWLSASSSKITKTTFKKNTCISKSLKSHSKATKYKFNGGAVSYHQGSNHVLSDCKFIGNKASNHGGAIFSFKSKLKIDKCEFNKNRAVYEDGGAVSFAGNKLTLTNSKFTNNLAYEDGGAMDSYSVSSKKIKITVKKCTFKSNTAYKCGGAIWMGVKTIYKITGSKFIKNKASSAGALEAEDGKASIAKCTFTGNKAAKVTSWTVKTKSGGHLAHSGGAILIKNKCKITKSVFKKNKAKYGKNVKVEINFSILFFIFLAPNLFYNSF